MRITAQEPRRLELLIGGVAAGIVEQREAGELTFSYHEDYEGCPLSLNMPVSNRVYGDKLVRPYLLGLLPDDARVLRALGRGLDVSGGNPFALLSAIGLDCPGAVQLCSPDCVEEAACRSQDYREITSEEVAARLLRAGGRAASWQAADEHWAHHPAAESVWSCVFGVGARGGSGSPSKNTYNK